MILTTVVNSAIQLLMFSVIPFLWWLATQRKHKKSFSKWLGIKTPKLSSRLLAIFFIGFVALFATGPLIINSIQDRTLLANYNYIGSGAEGYIAAIFYAFIQTALAEEILFRGFIAKRVISKTNFHFGCAIQAFLFGLIHVVSIYGAVSNLTLFLIFIFSTCAGWLMCYMNEKHSNGSILPSWILQIGRASCRERV